MNSIPHTAERPFVAVLTSILGNVQEIVRSEVRLAKAEVREEIAGITCGAAWLMVGVVSAFFALSFIFGAVFFALSYLFPQWVAALIVAGALSVISGVAFAVRTSIVKSFALHQSSASAAQPEEITA